MAFPMNNTTTFNLENVLRQNILSGQYYNKTCVELNTWEEVVDEIYDNVQHVEPWMSGNARGASTAFCLLHRLCTLQLTIRQVRDLLDHKDSPYIRAVGLLYLRYVCDGKALWKWFEQYVDDREMFSPSPDGPQVSIGDYARDLLLEQYYFETIFPRIPKPVMDQVVEELKARRLPHTGKGNGGAGGSDRRGLDDGNKRPASVKASLSVAMGQRAPNRAGAREDRVGAASRAGTSSGRSPARDDGAARDRGAADRDRDRGADRDRDRDRERDRGADRERERDRGAADRERDRGGRDRRDYDDRGGRESRDRSRDRGRDRDDRDRRDRDRSRERDDRRGDYDRRDRDRDYDRGGRDRASDRGRGADVERRRSRSR